MASAESQKPTCPVCNLADQVKTMEAAYNSGVERCAPPDMPIKKVSMLKIIFPCTILVGICVFLIIVLVGSEADLGPYVETVLVVITLIAIITVLVLSYVAFQRVVQGDAEATERFPAWDRAMAIWRSLYYCSRNDIVFDPQTKKQVSNEQLASLRSMDEEQAAQQSAAMAHQ